MNPEPDELKRFVKGRLRILSFNVAKNYTLLDTLLESEKDNFDIVFVQEPPW